MRQPDDWARLPAMLHTPFPLPALWTTQLDWFFLAIFPPLVDTSSGASPGSGPESGHVVARCGAWLVSCRCDDGTVAWSAEIDPEGGNGAFFLGHEDMYFTEQARQPPSCLGTVVAVDAGGQQRWRTDLDAMVALGSAAVHGDELCALSLPPASDNPTLLYRLALADGALRAKEPLPWPADAVLPVAGGLLVRNQRVADGAPGLYRLDATPTGPSSNRPTALLADAVPNAMMDLARQDDLLAVVTRAGGSHTARVYVTGAAGGMEPLWQAPIAGPAAALAGGDLLHVEDAEGGKASTLVCRDARTGAVRWRSALLPPQIPSISVAGAIVIGNHRKGQVVCRRRDGHVLGQVRGSYGPPAHHGDRLYLCRPGALLCVSLAGVDELGGQSS
jgi:hypothetical protein